MAIKYLDAKRLQGTNAERLALTTTETNSADFTTVDSSVTAGGSAGDYGFLTGNTTGSGDFSISCWIKPDASMSDKAVIFDQTDFTGDNNGFSARFNNSSGDRNIYAMIADDVAGNTGVSTGDIWEEDE